MTGRMSTVAGARGASSLLRTQHTAERPTYRLICFPFAGSGASFYRDWGVAMPSATEVISVQLPGREDRIKEPPMNVLTEISAALVEEVIPRVSDRAPFGLFGHSFGAALAFDVIRRLTEAGASELPTHLWVSALKPPHRPLRDPVHQLPEEELIEHLMSLNGMEMQGLDPYARQELIDVYLPALRADLTAAETHLYDPGLDPLAVAISAFAGVEDPMTSWLEVLEWGRWTRSKFALRAIPGDHFFIRSSPQLVRQGVADDIIVDLRELQEQRGR